MREVEKAAAELARKPLQRDAADALGVLTAHRIQNELIDGL